MKTTLASAATPESSDSLDVRPAAVADTAGIEALEGLSASTRTHLAIDLARDNHDVMVAIDRAGTIVGVGLLMRSIDEAHILDLAVAPTSRRRGIGTHLLRRLVAVARRQDATWPVTLEVRESNTAARRLYASHGFVVEGRRPGYYPADADGRREDALLMWLRGSMTVDVANGEA